MSGLLGGIFLAITVKDGLTFDGVAGSGSPHAPCCTRMAMSAGCAEVERVHNIVLRAFNETAT